MPPLVWLLGLTPRGIPSEEDEDVSLHGAQYKIRVYDTSGTLVAEVSDYRQLGYRRRVNEMGICQFLLNGNHALVSLIEDKYQIEVWRRNPRMGVDWYRDFSGLFRAQDRFYTDRPYFRATAIEDVGMLGWRAVMWYAGTDGKSSFAGDRAETIMKNIVSYNCAAAATTGNGRLRNGAITGITVHADNTGGNTLDWNCAYKNVLSELQDIARVAGGDFDLVKTGPAAWEFRFYLGQRGVDSAGSVTFSLGHGNMASPKYRYDRLSEATVAVVAGQGQGEARAVQVRTGVDYAAGNDIEIFRDARNRSTAAGLQDVGDSELDKRQARQELSFDVLQVPSSVYGKHYCAGGVLGDLVTARYDTIEQTLKIVGVTVTVAQGTPERIDVSTEAV